MLKIGLTGGIGAGKSTVSTILAERGAVIVDADVIAREVVAPGQPLLAELAGTFGPEVLTPAGELDRAALAAAAFADEESTAVLNALMHPAIRTRTLEQFARAAEADLIVHDVALLVENDMAPDYHLSLLVDVPAAVRLDRLVRTRGMDRADAEARIARQATDAARRDACDVVIDNSGSLEDTRRAAGALVDERLLPFARNLRARRRAERPAVALTEPGTADWTGEARRIIARLRRGTGERHPIEHIGSTAVEDLPAKDVIDLQLLVPDLAAADDLAPRLADLGFPGGEGFDHLGEDGREPKRFHANADPGRAVNLHVRTESSTGARFALRFRDLLRDDAEERRRYGALKRRLVDRHAGDPTACAEAKEPYFAQLRRRLVPESFDS
ncbi:dephospho-CoA kinase [Brevibacterium sanguinis]|uniref:Dephospho-CoA kinase n=2 Tax=Brevibacterium TaxID=1696 RepID=A0A366IJF7_9MICO|nr:MULTISPECIES: dephospho-CoA kinase [Brevibacterium]RBP64610.1 dephospho-CoA kinase [Brevibacterium sanguinis]RBP71747.1 dephospho-CoA kinase [Brevibacterium celere]